MKIVGWIVGILFLLWLIGALCASGYTGVAMLLQLGLGCAVSFWISSVIKRKKQRNEAEENKKQ